MPVRILQLLGVLLVVAALGVARPRWRLPTRPHPQRPPATGATATVRGATGATVGTATTDRGATGRAGATATDTSTGTPITATAAPTATGSKRGSGQGRARHGRREAPAAVRLPAPHPRRTPEQDRGLRRDALDEGQGHRELEARHPPTPPVGSLSAPAARGRCSRPSRADPPPAPEDPLAREECGSVSQRCEQVWHACSQRRHTSAQTLQRSIPCRAGRHQAFGGQLQRQAQRTPGSSDVQSLAPEWVK